MTNTRTPPPWLDRLLKPLYGQHILNGVLVAVGVAVVAVGMSVAVDFRTGMTAGLGAICVSTADQPNALLTKLRILVLAWLLAAAGSWLAAAALPFPPLELVVVVGYGLLSGLVLGWGRWAIPVSVLTVLSVVYALGAPLTTEAEARAYSQLFTLGGGLYVAIALALTRLFDFSDRRLTVSECVRELAGYLDAVASLYDSKGTTRNPHNPVTRYIAARRVTLGYMSVIEHQASLSDHLQTARALIFRDHHTSETRRLSAALVILLDCLDVIVSASADLAPLRLAEANSPLGSKIAELARTLARDLDHLSVTMVTGLERLTLPNRQSMLDDIALQLAVMESEPDRSQEQHRLLRAARMTRTRYGWVMAHLARLPAVLASDTAADTLLGDADLDAFVQRPTYRLNTLLSHVSWQSPVLHHALRYASALGFAYGVVLTVPGLEHGNWILLSVAVIFRGSYSLTKQRRDDRVIGTLLGCVLTGLLLAFMPPSVLLGCILVAIAFLHAFIRVHYKVAATASSVMALLALHFLDPITAPPVMGRMVDTLIGASIVFVFSHILPRWERQDAPRLVEGMLASTARYAQTCLQWQVPLQDYRLARKSLIESLAATSESVKRMRGEPRRVREQWADYGHLLAASYTTAAQIVTIRLLIRHNLATLDAEVCKRLLDETRQTIVAALDLSQPCPVVDGDLGSAQEDVSAIDDVLVLRCGQARQAAVQLHRLADQLKASDHFKA